MAYGRVQSPFNAVFAAATVGERWATDILHQTATPLAAALCNIQLLLNPNLIVIGGGIGLQQQYFSLLRMHCDSRPVLLRPTLRQAGLKGDAGIVGIADLARRA
jgi:N-acetylmannosamine-6-phosphate 2-epimerase / N-acetylmannosamine kinase